MPILDKITKPENMWAIRQGYSELRNFRFMNPMSAVRLVPRTSAVTQFICKHGLKLEANPLD